MFANRQTSNRIQDSWGTFKQNTKYLHYLLGFACATVCWRGGGAAGWQCCPGLLPEAVKEGHPSVHVNPVV